MILSNVFEFESVQPAPLTSEMLGLELEWIALCETFDIINAGGGIRREKRLAYKSVPRGVPQTGSKCYPGGLK